MEPPYIWHDGPWEPEIEQEELTPAEREALYGEIEEEEQADG